MHPQLLNILQTPFKYFHCKIRQKNSHCVFSGEFLISKNLNIRFGYNNRRRSEMVILDRKAMVGFAFGFGFKVNKFKFDYSRQFHHYSNPVNAIGVTTNISSF